jgi:tetratricopeptide repeat protein
VASNPRIDDLRRRLGKEPRLFAQLAEELRKEGELAEAIRVCREGLSRSPNYPSARITLGRALLDSGSTAAARTELETALKGAPDNILAGRLLAECLESLGDHEAALARYRSTLLLAPGDRQIQARINELEKRPRTAARPAEARPLPASGPIPVSQVQGEMELEIRELLPPSAPRPPAAEPPAPPLAALPEPDAEVLVEPLVPMEDESFELESAYDAPSSHWGAHHPAEAEAEAEAAAPSVVAPAAPATPTPASATPAPPSVTAAPPSILAPPPVAAAPPPEPLVPPVASLAPAPEVSPPVPVPPALPPNAVPVPAAELSTPTLAEIYASQGLLDKAVAVYRQILERDRHDDRARARLDELEKERSAAAARPPRLPPERRAAIQRTIGRMESWLAALHRAAP